MQRECASRQPVVGAKALAQGVKMGDVGISFRNSTGANAFTLAEVLLTLAIIGVVAALTIPAVVTKVTKDQYVVGLKKAYNTLKAVEREAVQEHGPTENWNLGHSTPQYDPTKDFEKYFLPHLDVLKNCGSDTTERGCWAEDVTDLNGSWVFNLNDSGEVYRFITSDGMAWAYEDATYYVDKSAIRAIIYVDVNGLKGPNKYGRDVFAFSFFPFNLGIKPAGSYDDYYGQSRPISTSDVNSSCKIDTSFHGQGYYCAAKVLSEGAMNY